MEQKYYLITINLFPKDGLKKAATITIYSKNLILVEQWISKPNGTYFEL